MKEKLQFTKMQKIIEACSIAILLFLIGYLVFNWSAFPNRIPSRYNSSGVADAWKNKSSIIFVPIICIVLYTVLTVVSFFPSSWNVPVEITEENKIRVYTTMRSMLCIMKLILIATFSYISVCSVQFKSLGSLFLPIMLITLFGTIIISIVLTIKRSKKI